MRQAQKEGRLYREQPFVMGYPARDLFDERGKMRQFWLRESLMDIMRPMTELCSWITKPIRLSPGMKKCLYRVIGDRWSYTGMHWKK